jgi:hypothetical protein
MNKVDLLIREIVKTISVGKPFIYESFLVDVVNY